MIEPAMLEALVRTIFAISRKEWTTPDINVIQKHLQEAIDLKGLDKVTEIALGDIMETLEILKSWDGPEPKECLVVIDGVFRRSEQELSDTIQINIEEPTVSA